MPEQKRMDFRTGLYIVVAALIVLFLIRALGQ